jgi:release factor glutamine methyltransferase
MRLRDALAAARRRFEAASIDDADLEAEVLLRHTLAPPPEREISRAYLLSHLDDPIEPAAATRFEAFISRRLAREPTAYITGHREFYGLDFEVTPAVLIPRPETEILVETAIEYARAAHPEALQGRTEGPSTRPLTIADIGTGSGCIAVALAVSLPEVRLQAVDISPGAIEVARRNARRHGVEGRIEFYQGDLLSRLTDAPDLVVANLPYVNTSGWAALPAELRDHEPQLALEAGKDGLDLIRRLLQQARERLGPASAILLEVAYDQAEAVVDLVRVSFPAANVEVRRDLAGHERVVGIKSIGKKH